MQGRIARGLGVGLAATLMAACTGAGLVTLPPAGQIFVVDALNNRIARINEIRRAGWTTFGSAGSGINQFSEPFSIFVSAAGQIFVADRSNNRIVRIDNMTGAGWTTFGTFGSGTNQFNTP